MGKRAAAALVVALVAWTPGASAQQVETTGSSDVALDRRLSRLLDREPWVIASDTRIRSEDTITGSVLVLDATLVHEGVITGDLVLVDAGVFVRHNAEVRGDLVNIGGGLYRSELARVGGTIIDLPDANYRVLREEGRIVIEASGSPARLRLDGFMGFRTPTYDRVAGLTARWGAAYRLPRVLNATPTLRAHGGWRTELGEPVYGAELSIRAGPVTIRGGYDRLTGSHDQWVYTDLRNSLNYLWDGDDFRNHYEAERSRVTISRSFGDAAKSFYAVLRLGGLIEDAHSLDGGSPWHLLGDGRTRRNPPIDDGRITSAVARVELEWHGLETDLVAGAEYEAGRDWRGGEYVFDRAAAWVGFAMHGLFDHTLEIDAFGQLPVSGDTLPKQRWSILGGSGTLQTAALGLFWGDHVAFVQSRYRIPGPELLSLPILGSPELELIHSAGRAWVDAGDATLVQEVGARLQFFGPYIQYMLRPDEPTRNQLVIGLAWPFVPGYPWEH